MNSRMGLILCILCSSSGAYTIFEGPGSYCEEGILNPGFGIVKKQSSSAACLNPADYQEVKTTALKLMKNPPQCKKSKKLIISAAYQHLFGQDQASKYEKDILYEKVPFEIFFEFQYKEAPGK